MSILNPTAEQLEQWMITAGAALPTNAMGERLALSNLFVATVQSRETANVLAAELVKARTEIARLNAVVNSVASVLLDAERPSPQTSAAHASPPRLALVPAEVDRGSVIGWARHFPNAEAKRAFDEAKGRGE